MIVAVIMKKTMYSCKVPIVVICCMFCVSALPLGVNLYCSDDVRHCLGCWERTITRIVLYFLTTFFDITYIRHPYVSRLGFVDVLFFSFVQFLI